MTTTTKCYLASIPVVRSHPTVHHPNILRYLLHFVYRLIVVQDRLLLFLRSQNYSVYCYKHAAATFDLFIYDLYA